METGEAWMRAISVSKYTPSPICGFDMFNYMGVMVCDRGTEAARDLFNLWYEESMEKVAKGEGPWTVSYTHLG